MTEQNHEKSCSASQSSLFSLSSRPVCHLHKAVRQKRRNNPRSFYRSLYSKFPTTQKKHSCLKRWTLIHISEPIITPSLSSSGATVKVTWLSSRWKSVPKMLSKTCLGVFWSHPPMQDTWGKVFKVFTWNLKIANPEKKCVHDSLLCRNVHWFVSCNTTLYDFKQREEFPLYHCIPYLWCMRVCGRFSYIDHLCIVYLGSFVSSSKQSYPEIPKWFIQKVQCHHRWIPSKIDPQHLNPTSAMSTKNQATITFHETSLFLSWDVQHCRENLHFLRRFIRKHHAANRTANHTIGRAGFCLMSFDVVISQRGQII